MQIRQLHQQTRSMSTKDKVIGVLKKKGILTVRVILQQTGLLVCDVESTLNELGENIVVKLPEGKTFQYRLIQ
jgi:hypothetical protein